MSNLGREATMARDEIARPSPTSKVQGTKRPKVNRTKRDPTKRAGRWHSKPGELCAVCTLDVAESSDWAGLIHVNHLRELSSRDLKATNRAVRDLRTRSAQTGHDDCSTRNDRRCRSMRFAEGFVLDAMTGRAERGPDDRQVHQVRHLLRRIGLARVLYIRFRPCFLGSTVSPTVTQRRRCDGLGELRRNSL